MFTASEDEKNILRSWRRRDEKNERGYQILKWLFHGNNFSKSYTRENIPVESFFHRIRLLERTQKKFIGWKVAASIAIILTLGSFIAQWLYVFDDSHVVLVTNSGQRTQAILPDGSKVWLNNCSQLEYSTRFGRKRVAVLKGEAFFQVAKDVTRPFYVYSDDLEVKVTGTQFNVRNYDNESDTEVALVEGSVKVIANSTSVTSLAPGELLSLTKETGRIVKNKSNVDNKSAWRNGILVIENAGFDDLIARLERWYNIKIEYNADDFKNIHYTGTIRNLRLDQVFDFIKLTIPIEVQMNENHIVLTKK